MKLIHLAGFTFTLLATLNASAAFTTDTWNGGTDFDTPGNWSLSAVPTTSNVAHFTGTPGTAQTVNISANTTVGQMTFSSSPSYTFGSTGGYTLTIDGGANGTSTLGTSAALTFNNAVIMQTLTGTSTYGAVVINVGGALTFNSSFTLNGSVSENSASPGASISINNAFSFGVAGNSSTFSINKGGTSTANPIVFNYDPTSATFAGTTAFTDNAAYSKIDIQTSIASGGLSALNVGSGAATTGAIYINKDGVSVAAPVFMGPTNNNTVGGTYYFGMDSSSTAAGSVSSNVTLNVVTGASASATDDFDVAANNTLTISGQIVDSSASSTANFGVTKTGAGTLILRNAAGNPYTNATTISAGTVYANNSTSGSGTGSGAVTINGGALAGNGNITGTGITVNGGGTLASGAVQSSSTINTLGGYNTTTGGLTVTNTPIAVTGATSGTQTTANTANLTFDLGAGSTAGAGPANFTTPNTNATTLSLSGSTAMSFTGYTSVSLVDLTNGHLQLALSTPYLLAHSSTGSDAAFQNLVIVTGVDGSGNNTYALSGAGVSGYVLGVNLTGVAGSTLGGSGTYAPISISEFESNGVTPLVASGTSYANPQLYIIGGNLEVVPEPSTWAELSGGFFVLILMLRRRGRSNFGA